MWYLKGDLILKMHEATQYEAVAAIGTEEHLSPPNFMENVSKILPKIKLSWSFPPTLSKIKANALAEFHRMFKIALREPWPEKEKKNVKTISIKVLIRCKKLAV